MSVLVYINSEKIAKNSFEAVTYGKKIGSVTVITNGNATDEDLAELGKYGADKVLVDRNFEGTDSQQVTRLVAKAANSLGASTIVFSNDLVGKAIAPRLAVRLKAGLVAGATQVPDEEGKIKVNVFSGKAYGYVKVESTIQIISLLPNSIQPEETGQKATVENFDGEVGTAGLTVKATKKPEGSIPLPEAELVVSAGRGLKGPENWGIVEELAETLGAATACSRPVSDIGWRPHHEHVGQTGVAIRPNLYIAAGISGAIQHLAGVNGSKVIVVINTDAEAPFFKAADYGVVGDAFEVLPRLNEAFKKFKASN
ncbi:MAG: electron transfer flavoprotein subunit alpha/FixB family protein [Crocinitomicaceae bacterium]|nr:electron transfer flavoprotein subunit alpha/FixB family protein [Crocinitomicaceae bacterium]